MRAVLVRDLGAPEVLRVETVPEPQMRPGEVTIKVDACGICFHDVVARNGTMRRGVKLPYIPGHEVAGTVVDRSPEVTQFKIGDRVATTLRRYICGHCRFCRSGREASCEERESFGDAGLNGGCAEFVCVGEDNVALVPDEVSLDHAAIAACAIGTQLNAVRDVARIALGERVLVLGAGGGLGIHGIQLAKLAGGEVLAVTSTAAKIDVIRAAGADRVVLIERGEDFSAKVRAATGGAGVDVVIDNVGTPVFRAVRRSLAPCARWVFAGQVTGDFAEFSPAQLFFNGTTLMSAKSGSREQLRDVLGLLQRGAVRAVVPQSFPLEEIARAHAMVEAGATTGRVVVRPSG